MASKSILTEAGEIIEGPRRTSYGNAKASFDKIATCWSALFGVQITGHQVSLAMIMLKALRENNKPDRDNRVDICGYAALADQIVE